MKKIFSSLLLGLSLYSADIKTIEDIDKMVAESQMILPQNINSKMVLMELDYNKKDSALEYTISFFTLDKSQLDMAKMGEFLSEALKINVCGQKTTNELFALNTNMRYLYYDRFGDFYYGEEVTPDFCK